MVTSLHQSHAPEGISAAYMTPFFRGFCPELDKPTGHCGRNHCKFVLAIANQDFDALESLMACNGEEYCRGKHQSLGRTMLHLAAQHGRAGTVANHLQNGADINCRDDFGNTPLALALFAHQYEAADLLAQYGADLNIADNRGRTILHYVAEHNWRDTAEIMFTWSIEKHLQLNYFDRKYLLPSHYAWSMNNKEMFLRLVKFGSIVGVHSQAQMLGQWFEGDALAFAWQHSPLRRIVEKRDIDILMTVCTVDSIFRHHLGEEALLLTKYARKLFPDPNDGFPPAILSHFHGLIRQAARQNAGVDELLSQMQQMNSRLMFEQDPVLLFAS